MKILKTTNMKLKLSTQLLIGVALLVVISSFISGSILRKQYDKIDKSNKYWYYKKMADQPFKHIKILQNAFNQSLYSYPAPSGILRFEKGIDYSVLSDKINYGSRRNMEEGDTLSCKVLNDTLFICAPLYTSYQNSSKEIGYNLVLTAPHLESITCLNMGTEIMGLNQDSLHFDLSGQSNVEFMNDYAHMNLIKANIKDRAVLKLSPLLKLKKLNVVLKDRAKLKMPIVPAEKFSIDAGDSTAIEGPSKFFKKENE
jgi:hypothetical protein